MNRDREQRYLEAQKLGMIAFLIAIAGIVVMSIIAPLPDDKGREVSLAARACWDQGLRAVLHRDGTVECRE